MLRSCPLLRSLALVVLLAGGIAQGASAATKTWTGAINNLWSNPGNWAGGVPVAGDRIAFPVSASNTTNTNDLTAGTVFFDITFLGSGYVVNGNTIGLSDGIPANNGFNNQINADLTLTAAQTLSGSGCCGGLTLAGTIAYGANAITIDKATVTGVIAGSGPLTAGDVVIFSANNTYTGATTVTGRWEVNGNQPSSNVSVGPGFFPLLCGIGTVGSVTTNAAFGTAQLSPGTGLGGGIGILTTGAFSFGTNSLYNVQLNGPVAGTSYDQLVVNGGVTIASGVSLNLSLGYSPSNGQVLRVIDNDGVDPVSGTFSGLPEGQIVTMNASDFQISYVGGTGNDVVLTVVAAAKTWTGAVNALWSVAGNWQGGVPGPGDPLVFPNGASNLTNTNDLPATNVYKQILFTGNGYVLNGNTIGLSTGIPANNGMNNVINANLTLTAAQTLSGSGCCGGLTLAGTIAYGANAITIDKATVTGVIAGSGALTVGDVVIFSANNTYTGATTVTGRWEVDGNQPSSNVSVGPGFFPLLCGIGTVGSVTTNAAFGTAQLSPGTGLGGGIGKLNTADLSLGSNTLFNVQLNGSLPGTGYDQVNVAGTIAISSGVSLNVSLGFTPALGQIFVIGLNDAADAVSGAFNALPQNTIFNIGPYPFEISYIGKTGNEIILTSLSGDSLNSAPVARPDTFVTAQNTSIAIGAPGVLINDTDPDLDPLTVVSAPGTTTQGGTLNVNGDGSFTYQPPVGFVGFDDFTYIISDGNDATDLTQVVIEVQDITPPTVTVIYPNGGEIFILSATEQLDWTTVDKKPITGVDLFISRDNGSTYQQIANNIPDNPPFAWVVTPPPTNTGATPVFSALLKVVARDSSGNAGQDVSDAPFAIHDPATATLLSQFQISAVEGGIELRWRLGEPGMFTGLTIDRATAADGPWTETSMEIRDEAGVTIAVDRTVEPGTTYFYRLTGTTREGGRILLGQLSGSFREVIKEFAISRITPNPSRGPMRIEYALPRESRVRLSVLDVQGREVALLADGVHPAGRHQTTWSGESARGEVAAGVYFVRCQALGKRLTERLVRTR